MYHIDLSFLQSKSDDVDVQSFRDKYNHSFHNIILNQVSDQSDTVLEINPELVEVGSVSQERVIEVYSGGHHGVHFCLIPESVKGNFNIGDEVIIRIGDAQEISQIIETGEIVKYKQEKSNAKIGELPHLIRLVNQFDEEKIFRNRRDEERAKPLFYSLIKKLKLEMKLVDVHFQFDRKKLFFFYTADGRVDFRQLAKELASEFKTRIELRQIGVRDEAKLIGGIGTCGREYCCTSFISSFKRIYTQFASEQNLSANLSKMTGPCGKLKCCLSFEIDT